MIANESVFVVLILILIVFIIIAVLLARVLIVQKKLDDDYSIVKKYTLYVKADGELMLKEMKRGEGRGGGNIVPKI